MKKKVLSLLLAVVMTFSLAVTANAAEETAQDLDGDIVILHTNDVHGAISGYAKVAALKDAYEARGAYVLLMDAGDFIQGDPTVSTSEGATAVELMNLAGYDVASMGNHEFDYGYQNLKDLEADADFTIVDANVLYNGQVAFEDNVVFTAPDGTKIGVFGLDTPETATKAHPAKIQGVTFLAGDKMFDCAQDQVDALEAEGCEYIICLGHLGIDAESTGNRSIDLLEKVEGIDVFIDGHSHSTLEDVKAAAGGTGKVGDTLVTCATIVQSYLLLITMPMGGLTLGTQPVISFNYGAANLERIKRAIQSIVALCVTFCVLMTVVTHTLSPVFVGLFTQNPEVAARSVRYIKVFTAMIIPLAIQYPLVDETTALGHVRLALFCSIFRKCVFLAGLLLLPALVSPEATFLSEPIADAVAATVTTCLFLHFFPKILAQRAAREREEREEQPKVAP